MIQSLQTGTPARAPDRTPGTQGRDDKDTACSLTFARGLMALKGLAGLVWTAEALRIAGSIQLMAERGGDVLLRTEQIDRVAAGMRPAPGTAPGPAVAEVLVGMAAVLALASGRMASQEALTRPFAFRTTDAGLVLEVARNPVNRPLATGGAS